LFAIEEKNSAYRTVAFRLRIDFRKFFDSPLSFFSLILVGHFQMKRLLKSLVVIGQLLLQDYQLVRRHVRSQNSQSRAPPVRICNKHFAVNASHGGSKYYCTKKEYNSM
jgi:hypothetical protein